MRTIKYRGRCAFSGTWRYGFYYVSKGNHIIRDENDRESIVLEKTVGQFTGLHDKNGKELYEGDMISDMEDDPMVLPVIFDNEFSQFAVDVSYHKDGSSIDDIPTCYENGFEIIGNVFENPDLVKL